MHSCAVPGLGWPHVCSQRRCSLTSAVSLGCITSAVSPVSRRRCCFHVLHRQCVALPSHIGCVTRFTATVPLVSQRQCHTGSVIQFTSAVPLVYNSHSTCCLAASHQQCHYLHSDNVALLFHIGSDVSFTATVRVALPSHIGSVTRFTELPSCLTSAMTLSSQRQYCLAVSH